ncbi:hypothetical protein ACU8KH_06633 [Lachancea thermotolerans]
MNNGTSPLASNPTEPLNHDRGDSIFCARRTWKLHTWKHLQACVPNGTEKSSLKALPAERDYGKSFIGF